MNTRVTTTCAAVFAVFLNGPLVAAGGQDQAVHRVHETYLAAINSNNADAILDVVTDDIVLIAPNTPVLDGKSQVQLWIERYLAAFDTSWQKTSVEFIVTGDWAYGRYIYTVIDTPRDGGTPQIDSGNGLNIYRLGTDGNWRVARDVWATDRALPDAQTQVATMPCDDIAAPC